MTRSDVLALDALLERARYEPQHAIADHVAVGVVDRFEMINVSKQQRERRILGVAFRYRLFQGSVEVPAIAEPGERVDQALVADGLELAPHLPDFLAQGLQLLLQLAIAGLVLLAGGDQALDRGAHAV